MQPRRCNFRSNPENLRCNGSYYGTVKVQVVHPETFRKAWQHWHFCELHFNQFLKSEGKGWVCHYRDEKRADAPVIGFTITSTFF